jgi:hypothetical protein
LLLSGVGGKRLEKGGAIKTIENNEGLVSMCGLYCGACGRFLKGACRGCADNAKATWCRIRSCCLENSHLSCADCAEFEDPSDCGKSNNLLSRVVGFFLNSDRRAGVLMIRERGRAGFADFMTTYSRVAIRRRG